MGEEFNAGNLQLCWSAGVDLERPVEDGLTESKERFLKSYTLSFGYKTDKEFTRKMRRLFKCMFRLP